MSEAEIAMIIDGIAAYNRGDLGAMIEFADPEIELVPVRSLLEGGSYHGHEGMRRFFSDMDSDWSSRAIDDAEVRELGGFYVVLADFKAVGRASGAEVSFPLAWRVRVRDGRLLAMEAFTEPSAALESGDGDAGGIGAGAADRAAVEAALREAVARFNEQGVEALSDPGYKAFLETLLAPEFEALTHGAGAMVVPGTYRGADGFLDFVRNWTDVWSEVHWELEQLVFNGDFAAVRVRLTSRGRESGVEVDLGIGWVFELRGRRVLRWTVFVDVDEAWRAAGLDPGQAQ